MIDPARWYPVAARHDLAPRHVYRTTLAGHDLIAWAAQDGTMHVWADRCPHRGVRLSLGEVVGNELRCQYHAWRFAGHGGCTFIPAQPDLKVPGSIHADVWPIAIAGGHVWTGIAPAGSPPAWDEGAPVRAIPIARPAAAIEAAIAAAPPAGLTLAVQPLDTGSAVVRGLAHDGDVAAADLRLCALRRDLERAA